MISTLSNKFLSKASGRINLNRPSSILPLISSFIGSLSLNVNYKFRYQHTLSGDGKRDDKITHTGGIIGVEPIINPTPPKSPIFSTPLQKHIYDLSLHRGPLPLPLFHSLSLHHPEHGYYTKGEGVIGTEGDFVTR